MYTVGETIFYTTTNINKYSPICQTKCKKRETTGYREFAAAMAKCKLVFYTISVHMLKKNFTKKR
jgi:hypothetical protein